MRSDTDKFTTIISKNTFFFHREIFEEKNEVYLNGVKETLFLLKNEVSLNGLRKETISKLLAEKDDGLVAILALTGFSNEFFKRLITVIRVIEDEQLSKLVFKSEWNQEVNAENLSEWSDTKIHNMIRKNESFRNGIVNIFFEGATIPFLKKTLPPFEIRKLSISKLNFDENALLDTLVRYKEKGSYSGNKENNPERVIEELLNGLEIPFEAGDLKDLVDNAPMKKRTMDFIIPSKENPKIIIESSYLATTSSGMGDKAKTEIAVGQLIKEHYPNAKFIGFIDGVGWYVRRRDLKRMIDAFDEVFTFHESEMLRFERFLIEELP